MPKKKGKGKKGKKSGGKGGNKKKKQIVKKTCGTCFSDLPKEKFSKAQWGKKSMDCVCSGCLSKKKNGKGASGKGKEKETAKKTDVKEENKEVVLPIGELPKQYQPKVVEKTEEQVKWDEIRSKQTEDPSLKIKTLFSEVGYPVGEIQHYEGDYKMKLSEDAEFKKEMEKKMESFEEQLDTLREVAEVHKAVRLWSMKTVKPGVKLVDIAAGIEQRVSKLMDVNKLKGGFAFPIGLSVNHVAAHDTPNPGDETVVKEDDVLKIDIGLHLKGNIIDSAFTMSWNPVYDKLLESVREATNAGVKALGVDVRLCDVGERIQEVMESYEVEIDGKMERVKTIENLNGHSLDLYKIHSGITVPCVRGGVESKIQEGDLFAIETFGSIFGRGRIADSGECSHFMLPEAYDPGVKKGIKLKKSKDLYELIGRNYNTLCFCPRWITQIWPERNYNVYLKSLIKQGIIKEHPPLCEKGGAIVAQYEHTVMMLPTHKEVFSRGDDF